MSEKSANRLIRETSPYLLQHAHNPVDWYPWGDEAIEQARKEDKPILLSIGYSACHWCHVMERESFENDDIAAVMNEYFISIKVDREERPDLDDIYMHAVQMIAGQGGWPMTVFLSPDLRPFYGGTYFPPDDRYGRPGFKRILKSLADAYREQKDQIRQSGEQIAQNLQQMSRVQPSSDSLTEDLIRNAVRELENRFEEKWWVRECSKISAKWKFVVNTSFLEKDRRRCGSQYGGKNTSAHGTRGNVRSAWRRIPPLFDR